MLQQFSLAPTYALNLVFWEIAKWQNHGNLIQLFFLSEFPSLLQNQILQIQVYCESHILTTHLRT